MAGMVFLGAAAAFGIISLIWTLVGWLLPDGKGAAVVCWEQPDEGILVRVKWLQSLGLLRCPLLIVTNTEPFYYINNSTIEYCRRESLFSRLEQERIRINGTGNGDSSGNNSGGCLPEL